MLLEYIRHCLRAEDIYSFGEYPLSHDSERVLAESRHMKVGFENLIHDGMDLAFYSKNALNQLNCAAWVGDDGKIFEFVVITSNNTPESIFSRLVRDCMEDYAIRKKTNKNLKLEVKVEDYETEKHLAEIYGLSILRESKKIAIMGFHT